MKKLLILVALLGTMWSMTSCNTVKGLGRDVEDVGDAMKDAAN